MLGDLGLALVVRLLVLLVVLLAAIVRNTRAAEPVETPCSRS
jgi:hypothetical protein